MSDRPLLPPPREFRPHPANIAAGFVLGLLAWAGAGAVVYALMQNLDDQLAVGLLAAGALVLFVIGIAILYWTSTLVGWQASFRDEGFEYGCGSRRDVVRWTSVVKIHETFLWPFQDSPWFTVLTDNGRAYHFGRNTIDDIQAVGALLHEAAERHKLPWQAIKLES